METILQKLNKKGYCSYADITYGDGEVSLTSDGVFFALDIQYIGNLSANILLPRDWFYIASKNRIFILRIGVSNFPIKFMTYEGRFRITDFIVYNGQSNNVKTSYSTKLDTFNDTEDTFAELNSEWNDLSSWYYHDSDPLNIKIKNRTSTFKQVLSSSSGKLIDKDGNKYIGKYFADQNGNLYSGEKRTKESKLLTNPFSKKLNKQKILRSIQQIKGDYNG